LHALDVSKNKDDHRPAKKHGIPPFWWNLIQAHLLNF
jgi:hypothetical protein